MSSKDFLVEIGTEELPPKALRSLSIAFAKGLEMAIDKAGLEHGEIEIFATPRRLAVLVSSLATAQPDKVSERYGPAVKAAFDENGAPTPAANGFAKSCGVNVADLENAEKDGIEKLFFSATVPGQSSDLLLPGFVNDSLAKLPIPKRMRWGSSREEFVRPVHWVVMLLGENIVPASVLGIDAGRQTRGHRFHADSKFSIPSASDYKPLLSEQGHIIPDFCERLQLITDLIEEQGVLLNASPVIDQDLLEEVTSLVEYPVALTGKFSPHFLEVPPEALIYALKSHQKCFYLLDKEGNLLPNFITISNIRSTDPEQVVEGNERVIRPRLADAEFFFNTDKKRTLESHQDQLKSIIFQKELGTVFEKSQRVEKLASNIADILSFNADNARRASLLAKCDLVTNMVGEFAELQGLMGYYYAKHDGENPEVAKALHEQYMPKFAGDSLPSTDTGTVLALADKLDTMAGMFAIGQPPTGSKDPFALRRSAIGVLRILVEKQLDLNIFDIVVRALDNYSFLTQDPKLADQLFDFLLERFRAWYQDEGIPIEVYQSVLALRPQVPADFHNRVQAVEHFRKLPVASTLAASNKRVSNILEKESSSTSGSREQFTFNADLLSEEAEKNLATAVLDMSKRVTPLFEAGEYSQGLSELAGLNDTVNEFFDSVLVNCDDEAVKGNRIALLRQLRSLFLQAADISCLHTS